MNLNERQQEILKELGSKRQVRVNQLAKALFASEMTIRRDLEYLEQEGFLTRCHGGAIPLGNHLHYPIKYRMWVNKKEKKELAQRAAEYLQDDQVIFFNSSSTSTYLAPFLKERKGIHVITNSMHLLSALGHLHIPCTITGGNFHGIEQCLCGSVTEAFINEINPDLAILSCEGITEDGEITDSHLEMAQIAKLAVKRSKKVIFLMDPSKLGNRYTYTVCNAKELSHVLIL